MKKIFLLIIASLVLVSCSKKEVPFEAFSPEAFAYDLGESWEVNGSVRVKGFTQIENETTGLYSASLSLSVDLIKPDGSKDSSKFSYKHEESNREEILDAGLDAQFELDSTYREGKYILVFNVRDLNSEKGGSTQVEFEMVK